MIQEKTYPMRQHTATIEATVDDTAFRIARIQPLHLGHIDAIKQAFAQGIKKVLIGIGSANKKGTADNPFDAEERKKMVMDVLIAEGLEDKCSVYLTMDTGNDKARRKLIDNAIEPFSTIISDNNYLTYLFPDKKFIHPEMKINARGTLIRDAILQKDFSYLSANLHPMTFKTLEDINAYEKMEKILGAENIKIKLATDLVLRTADGKIVLIRRKNKPFGRALPGGMLEKGERAMIGGLREGCEEVGGFKKGDIIEINGNKAKLREFEIEIIRKLSYLDDPERDPRGHTISFPFEAKVISGELKASSDAKSIKVLSEEEIEAIPYEERAFKDHIDAIRETYK